MLPPGHDAQRGQKAGPWSHPDRDPSVSTHSSPEHITVLVPRLTLAPSTTTRRQSKDYPPPPDTLGAQPGVKEERNGNKGPGAASLTTAGLFPLPSPFPGLTTSPDQEKLPEQDGTDHFPEKGIALSSS